MTARIRFWATVLALCTGFETWSAPGAWADAPVLTVISYDDGKPLRMDMTANASFAVRFTPSGPFHLLAVDVMVRNDYNTKDGCQLWVAQAQAGKPVWPATSVGQVPPPLPDSSWVRFNLAGPMYFESDFFIVAQQKGGPYPDNSFWLGIDYGTITNRTVRSYNNGQTWQTESLGDALIRAAGQYGSPPCTISNQYPPEGGLTIPTTTKLTWTPCPLAAGQDLYIGTDLNAVLTAQPGSAQYTGRLPTTTATYEPGPLKPCTGYYWRVDTLPCPSCPPTKGPVVTFRTTCDAPPPAQPKGNHSTVTTSDGSIRDDELADYVCEQINKNGGKVKDVKIIVNSCYGGGLLDDFQRVFGPDGRCKGIPWVAGAASAASEPAWGWDDPVVSGNPGLGSTFTDALAGSRASPTDNRKGTIRDRTGDNVAGDLEEARLRDDSGPNVDKLEDPVVAWGNGGENIKWHEAGTKHKAIVFGGSQTNTRHHNNVNNMEQALKEVWPEGSYDIKKIDGGTTKDLKDAIAEACKGLDDKTELVLYIDDHGDTHFDLGEFLGWPIPKTIAYPSPVSAALPLHSGWQQGLRGMYLQGDTLAPTLDMTLLTPIYGNDWNIMLNDTRIPLPAGRLEPGYHRLIVDWTCIQTGQNDLSIAASSAGASMQLGALVLSSGPINEIAKHLDGPVCTPANAPKGDLNLDCIVDFRDVAILAEHWLQAGPFYFYGEGAQ